MCDDSGNTGNNKSAALKYKLGSSDLVRNLFFGLDWTWPIAINNWIKWAKIESVYI